MGAAARAGGEPRGAGADGASAMGIRVGDGLATAHGGRGARSHRGTLERCAADRSASAPLGSAPKMNDQPLREVELAGPEHLDPNYVAAYDQKAGFDPADDLETLRARGLGARSTLIDFGAGTGAFAVAAAAICRRVIAVDVSPAMVQAIRSRANTAGAINVECVEAGFLTYQHTGDAPGFIYTRHALHHLPDLWKGIALGRLAGLLAPGGVLFLRDLVFAFEPSEAAAGIESWLETGARRPEDGWTREELETHVRDEYSTYTWLLEPMLVRAGFEITATEYGKAGAYAGYICVKA
jgi:SAM-dependent methyltransferase